MLAVISILSFIINVYLIDRLLVIHMKHKYLKKRVKNLEVIERKKIDENFFDYDYSLKNKDTIYVNEKDKIVEAYFLGYKYKIKNKGKVKTSFEVSKFREDIVTKIIDKKTKNFEQDIKNLS